MTKKVLASLVDLNSMSLYRSDWAGVTDPGSVGQFSGTVFSSGGMIDLLRNTIIKFTLL